MKIKKILLSLIIGFMTVCWVTVAVGLAQNDPPKISVSLATNKLIYLLDDPGTPQADPEKIQMNLSLKNDDLTDIITSKGFSALPFHLMLTFIDPDGKGITTKEIRESLSGDPPPPPVLPVGGELVQAEPVEILPDGRPGGVSSDPNPWTLSLNIPDAHAYYSLTKAGRYSVKAIIPMRTYPPPIDYTVSSVPYERIDSSTWAGVIESNTVNFSLLADADGDGYYYPDAYGLYNLPDCDDNNPNVNPGVSEIRGNGIDDDCNPSTSDGAVTQIVVLNPNGGEIIPSGSTYVIKWAAPSNVVKFDLKYSLNNGTAWKPIASKVTGTSYNWTVPIPLNNKKKCLVKIIGYNASNMNVGQDRSDGTFTIEVIRVTSPNGGESLTHANAWTIRWQTNGTVSSVASDKIYYTDNGGATWNLIAPRIDNLGYYPWEVPYVYNAKTKCKVKVVLKAADGTTVGSDISDVFFTIQP